MVRELREETGIEVSEEKIVFFRSVAVRHAGRDFGYHMFSLRLNERSDIRLSPNEHQGYQWVTPEEAPALPLVHDQDECIQMFFSK